jgi:hypothetical protein
MPLCNIHKIDIQDGEYFMNKFVLITICSFYTALAFAGGSGSKSHKDNTTLFPKLNPDISMATPPPATKLSAPAFQAVINNDNTELAWMPSDGADRYHVQVATDPNFKWLFKDEHNIVGTKLNVSGLEKGKTYFWRVAPWKSGNMASTNKGTFTKSYFEVK